VTALGATSRRPIAVVGATGLQERGHRPRTSGRERPGAGVDTPHRLRCGARPDRSVSARPSPAWTESSP
jgi:hypothetical protein